MKNTDSLFNVGLKILKVRVAYSIWDEMMKSIAFFTNI